MGRVTASVFRNGKNQAIRIPVDMSLDVREVTIEKRGDALIIRMAEGLSNRINRGGGWWRVWLARLAVGCRSSTISQSND